MGLCRKYTIDPKLEEVKLVMIENTRCESVPQKCNFCEIAFGMELTNYCRNKYGMAMIHTCIRVQGGPCWKGQNGGTNKCTLSGHIPWK